MHSFRKNELLLNCADQLAMSSSTACMKHSKSFRILESTIEHDETKKRKKLKRNHTQY